MPSMSSPLSCDAVLVLDDLRQLDEVERVHVERLELGVGADLVGLGAELLERLEHPALDLLTCSGAAIGLLSFVWPAQAVSPPSTVRVTPVT